MSYHFILDGMLPRDLAEYLVASGFQAQSRGRLKLVSNDDATIWLYAERVGAIVISKDSDFETLAKDSLHGRLIHLRGPNMSTSQILDVFRQRMPEIISALDAGERLIKVW